MPILRLFLSHFLGLICRRFKSRESFFLHLTTLKALFVSIQAAVSTKDALKLRKDLLLGL